MGESSEVRALEKIFTEVDESQIKITFSSQCIKAQAFLVDKIKKNTEHQKEIFNYISSANKKLEAEIKCAEQEIKNLKIALDTIKSANVELRKEWLLKKAEKLEITERIEIGEKKYEQLWLSCKSRYESIPHVQKYLQGKDRCQSIQDNINDLRNQSEALINEIKVKKNTLFDNDQKRIIDLAKFLVHDRPKLIKAIDNKNEEIEELAKEINDLEDQDPVAKEISKIGTKIEKEQSPHTDKKIQYEENLDEGWPSLSKNENDAIVMPRLQLMGDDLDLLSIKLDQIKKVDSLNTDQTKANEKDTEMINNECGKTSEECTSSFFNNLLMPQDLEHKSKSYSDRKLIHILDDVKLEKNHTLNIISKVDLNQLYNVNFIQSELAEEPKKNFNKLEDKVNKNFKIEEIEELHNKKDSGEIVIPPTQFLDERKNSQEKKKVSFATFPTESTNPENDQNNKHIVDSKINETINSQQDLGTGSEEDYSKVQDKILKQHNLHSSPEFVYTKHSYKMTEDKVIVTSKFFDDTPTLEPGNTTEDNKIDDINQKEINIQENAAMEKNVSHFNDTININQDLKKPDFPIKGFLFNHGSQGISDSLNLSESTAGFEEGDEDFVHGIDSSVLLSPKADIPMEIADNNIQVLSQEAPNFMSGVRKTGLSLFGWSQPEAKSDSNIQNTEGTFNFNFGGEEKKNRGGLFSMFR